MRTHIKSAIALTISFMMATSLSSCFRLVPKEQPSETLVTREFNLEGFNGIEAAKKIVLHYSNSDQYSVKAEGPENMVSELRCGITKAKVLSLEVYQGEKFAAYNDSEKIHVWVRAPKVNRFSAMTDAVIKCDSLTKIKYLSVETFNSSEFLCPSLQAENLLISAYNGASVTIDLCQADIVTASAFNSGSIKITGKIGSMISLEGHNGSMISFTGEAPTVNATSFNGADIQLEGEFQTIKRFVFAP